MRPEALKKLVADLNQDYDKGLSSVTISVMGRATHYCLDQKLEYNEELDILSVFDDGTNFIYGASITSITI